MSKHKCLKTRFVCPVCNDQQAEQIKQLEAKICPNADDETGFCIRMRGSNKVISEQAEQITALKDGLDIYGSHRVGCKNLLYDRTDHCDCGFDELMKAAQPQKGNNDEV